MFTVTLFTITKIWKHPKYLPVDEQIEKLSHTHKYYLVIKKKDILPLTTWLDLKDFMPNKISQPDKNTVWSLLYMEAKDKNKQNPRIQKRN